MSPIVRSSVPARERWSARPPGAASACDTITLVPDQPAIVEEECLHEPPHGSTVEPACHPAPGSFPDQIGGPALDRSISSVALDLGAIGVWCWDVEGGVMRFSPVMDAMLGFPAFSSAPSIEKVLELVHPNDRIDFGRLVRDVMRGQGPVEQPCRVARPDGSLRWLNLRGCRVSAPEGAVLVFVALDVTSEMHRISRAAAENGRRLNEVEQRFRSERAIVSIEGARSSGRRALEHAQWLDKRLGDDKANCGKAGDDETGDDEAGGVDDENRRVITLLVDELRNLGDALDALGGTG